MHRRAVAIGRAFVVVLLLVIGACGSGAGATTTGPAREIVHVQVIVDEDAASSAEATAVEFAVARHGELSSDVVYTHPITTQRDRFDIDVTEAIGVDVILSGTVVVPLNRAFWEANAAGPIVVRIQRAGVMVRRKIIGPGGCAGDAREGSRCSTVADKQYLPLPLTFGGPTVLPVRVVIDSGFFDDVVSGPLVIETVDAGRDVGEVLVQRVLEASKPVLEDVTLAADATLRLSIGGTRVVDIPPQLWRRSWSTMTITYHDDVAVVRRRISYGGRLSWHDVRIPFSDAVDGETS